MLVCELLYDEVFNAIILEVTTNLLAATMIEQSQLNKYHHGCRRGCIHAVTVEAWTQNDAYEDHAGSMQCEGLYQ
jgi:hypothetical protein